MSEPTLPVDPEGQLYNGSLYLTDGTLAETGTGSIYLENGDLLVSQGVTSLQKTFIHTTAGALTIDGSNGIDAQVSGDILLQSSLAASSAVRLNVTNAAGTVTIDSAGTGTNAIDLNATAGGIDMDASSSISATAGGQLTLESTSTSSGAVTINANGNGASLVLNATGTGNTLDVNVNSAATVDSSTITLTQTGTATDAFHVVSAGGVEIEANDATNGKFTVTAAATGASAVSISATDTDASTTLVLSSAGTGAQAITLDSSGGIYGTATSTIELTTTATGTGTITLDSAGEVKIDTTDTTNGVKIATETSGVPVLIGTSASITSVAGDLKVADSVQLDGSIVVIKDNLVQLNYSAGSAGIDVGILERRYQTPNDTSLGNVVENSSNSDTFVPQESGAFQAGSSTPGTLVLGAHSSSTDDFYNGWWIRITSGSGSGQVRRIKDYVGSTKTATLFVTSDNTPNSVPAFADGLDLATAPSATDTYELFNQSSISLYWDESTNYQKLAGLPTSDLPGVQLNVVADNSTQYADFNSGTVKISPKKHYNMQGSASGTTITMTLKDVVERVSAGHKVLIESSSGFSPSINGTYTVVSVPTDNTFTFTVGSSTTSSAGSSATVSFLNTSKLYVNSIELNDSSFGALTIPGLGYTEDISISNTSTTPVLFTSSTIPNIFGSYRIIVQDISTAGNEGAMSTFDISRTNNATRAGDVNRTTSSRGDEGQRVHIIWDANTRPALYHQPAGSTARTNTYRVRVYSIY